MKCLNIRKYEYVWARSKVCIMYDVMSGRARWKEGEKCAKNATEPRGRALSHWIPAVFFRLDL